MCVCAHFCFVTHTNVQYIQLQEYVIDIYMYMYMYVPLKCRVNASINTCTQVHVKLLSLTCRYTVATDNHTKDNTA